MAWTAVHERKLWLLSAAKFVSDRLDCIELHLISRGESSAFEFVTKKSFAEEIVSRSEMNSYWNCLTPNNTVFSQFSHPFQNGGGTSFTRFWLDWLQELNSERENDRDAQNWSTKSER